ncbi:MAG: restriction endonuclease subunit S [Ottowia sp.]|nr:restriction endonuclease subunit S [Ottowia sp.]
MDTAWLTHSLGDVVTITKGRKPPHLIAGFSGDGMPYATASFFRNGTATQFVPANDLADCIITPQGCPVLIWDGSNAGEAFVGQDAVLASTMALIQPNEAVVSSGFCYFFLKTAFNELNGGTTGSTIPHVNKLTLTSLQIPALPLAEQRLISDFLFRMEKAVAIQSQFIEATTELKRATMRELFTYGLRGEALKETEIGLVPESWEVVPLGSLGKIGNGTTPNRQHTDYWHGGTVPWITSGKMYEREITDSETHVTTVAIQECHLPLLKPGAVLVAIVGQGKTLGHCAVLGVEATVSRHVGFIQPQETIIFPGFLRSYLESQYTYLRQLAAGNGSTRAALTGSILKNLLLPLPSLEEQREIVTILDAIDRKIELHRKKRIVLHELFQSLLHKLMTGEIRAADLDLSALSTGAAAA